MGLCEPGFLSVVHAGGGQATLQCSSAAIHDEVVAAAAAAMMMITTFVSNETDAQISWYPS